MTAPRLPGSRSHLERLISKGSSGSGGMPEARIRKLIGFTAIANMLNGLKDDAGQPRLVLKGGASLQLRLGSKARATADLDTVFNGDLDDARTLIAEALHRGWSEFKATLGDEEAITRAGIVPPPRRYKVKLTFKGESFSTVPFEMSRAEGHSLDAPEVRVPAVSLEPVQLPDSDPVAFLPARYQIAQKLHACTEPPTPEHPNERVRDVYDIILIDECLSVSADFLSLREACEEIFALRGKQPWPPTVIIQPSWPQQWRRIREDEESPLTLDEAVAQVMRIVEQLGVTE